VSLHSLEDKNTDNVLVSVAAVVRVAKILSTFSSLQTVYTDRETAPLVLAYEVGKHELLLRPEDKIVVLTDSEPVHRLFSGSMSVMCIDLASHHHQRVFSRDGAPR
jgi:hypothetical protein